METNNKGTLKEAKKWVDKFNDKFLENYPEFIALKESVSKTKSKQIKKSTKPIQLISYDEKPLSDQLKAVTMEPFGDNYQKVGDIYTHLPTGQRFIVPIEKQEKPTNKKVEITEAIEALNLTLEFTESKEEIKQITEAIEALEITLEFL